MPHYLTLKMVPRRWPAYTFALVCALFLAFVALNAPPYEPGSLPPFATACTVLAIVTFLWIGLLLCFSRSEVEYEHALTRCYAHIASFAVLAVLWFGLGVFFAIHADLECRHHTRFCKSLWISTMLAFLIFLSSCLCVAIVMCPIAITRVGYDTHVEDAREMARNGTRHGREPDDMQLPDISRPLPTHIRY